MQVGKVLDVYYHGRIVGSLAETPDKKIAFQYSDSWVKSGFAINPMSLPLKSDVFVPNDRSRERFGGLFGVFADSLPDSWGELLLDRHLASLGIDRDNITTLERLAYIGRSGMGALEYYPARETDFDIDTVSLDFDTIAEECEKILSSEGTNQLDLLYKMGGSSGGTRPKILLFENGRDWIVKFPAKKDPDISGKREYDYSVCAKKCGINMAETVLIKSSICDGYFMTERFDRNAGTKILSVTFAGLLEADFRAPSCDYETFMKLTGFMTKDRKNDKEQLFRTMCFNVATHNLDDHTKNFSFLYTEDCGWKLAPAYDLTYSETYWGEHTTSVNGRGKDIKNDDILKVGTDSGLKKDFCIQCIEEIADRTGDLSEYLGNKDRKSGKHISFQERIPEFTSTLKEGTLSGGKHQKEA